MSKRFPIPPGKEALYKYYKLDFDKDGCPMKRIGANKLAFHPLYPTYLVNNYIGLYNLKKEDIYLRYSEEIIDLSFDKSSDFRDSKVFYYHPDSGLVNKGVHLNRFYSALTQSRWIDILCQMERINPGKYSDKIKLLCNSLFIEVKHGGVLRKTQYGWIAEEYPKDFPLVTLNGWITVLLNLCKNLDVLSSGKCRPKVSIKGFLSRNLDAMERLLPLFDMPNLGLSRYQLSGMSKVRIDSDSKIHCKEFFIKVPGMGAFNSIEGKGGRWDNYVFSSNENRTILNAALSFISYPKENLLNINIFSQKKQKIKFYIGRGDFNPKKTMLVPSKWESFSEEININSGLNNIVLKIPISKENLFAYPTPFTKYMDGKDNPPYNTYHFIHIDGLYELYKYSNRKLFKKYHDIWRSYVDGWHKIKELEGCQLSRFNERGGGKA